MPPFANSVSLHIDKNAYWQDGYSILSEETLEYGWHFEITFLLDELLNPHTC